MPKNTWYQVYKWKSAPTKYINGSPPRLAIDAFTCPRVWTYRGITNIGTYRNYFWHGTWRLKILKFPAPLLLQDLLRNHYAVCRSLGRHVLWWMLRCSMHRLRLWQRFPRAAVHISWCNLGAFVSPLAFRAVSGMCLAENGFARWERLYKNPLFKSLGRDKL